MPKYTAAIGSTLTANQTTHIYSYNAPVVEIIKGDKYKVVSSPKTNYYKIKHLKSGREYVILDEDLYHVTKPKALSKRESMNSRAQLSKKAKHLLITKFSSDSAVRAAVKDVDAAINDMASDLSDMKRLIRELNPANEADDFSESLYNLQYAFESGVVTSMNKCRQKVARLEQVSEAYY